METHFHLDLKPKSRPKRAYITWEKMLTITQVETDYPSLLELYHKYDNITLNLKQIVQFDLAALQLLMSFWRSSQKQQKTVQINGTLYPEASDLLVKAGLEEEVIKLGLKLDLNHS